MKKILSMMLAAVLAFGLVACSSKNAETTNNNQAPTTVTIKSFNANKELVDLTVPYNPQRIAILDMASLDIIDSIGLGDRVVGSAGTTIDYLQKYVPGNSNNIKNLGTIKTADMVELAACEPDIIFIGGRLSASYDEMSKIAPVVYLGVDAQKGVVKSTGDNAKTIATIFGKEAEVDAKLADFDARINKIKTQFGGKNAVVGMYSGSNYNVLGNDGRCSIIGKELGFNNMGVSVGETTATHGNEASWETIVKLNPEYMFVMDRNTAISSTEGNPAVKDAIENDLIKTLDIYKNGKIVYLEHPNVWYTAEGGIQALDVMLKDVESALIK